MNHALVCSGLLLLFISAAHGQEAGLAAKYPSDVGIGRDPAILFHDDFEEGKIGAAWDEISLRKSRQAREDYVPVQAETDKTIARGKRSAKVQLRKDGYEDVTFVKWLRPGYDELYMRYYVRYGKDYGYHSHGGSGFMADAGKGGFKGAGKAPDGDKHFWATLEPIGRPGRWPWEPPGALIFYAYWWKMKPDGRGNYRGNWFQPKPDQVPKRETWVCVEWRVKANTAGRDDGELDCWIDGKKCGVFRNINWRSTDALKINKVHLSLWLESAAYEVLGGGTTRTVWYDDVVVATQYIGPKKP
ncbi:hypothetical protein HRbin36_01844 [bacterium HR36]|nr:hypothetical protein HRbin36_01844 [bacterium HR36]